MQDIADRRSGRRFSLRLAVKCQRIELAFIRDGIVFVGESLNISSKGLLFTTTEAFQTGQDIEASIDWPMRLDNSVGLTLVVKGAIVRKADDLTAMRIENYEFRTRGPAVAPEVSPEELAPDNIT